MMITRETLQKRRGPIVNEGVVVQCNGFRCLAYCDKDSKWRDFFTNELIADPVAVMEIGVE